jgi:hypothetical protein
VILRQPEERNAHVYTTSLGDWVKGKKMYQMKIAARKRIFIKESATLPVGLSNEQEVTVRVDGLL